MYRFVALHSGTDQDVEDDISTDISALTILAKTKDEAVDSFEEEAALRYGEENRRLIAIVQGAGPAYDRKMNPIGDPGPGNSRRQEMAILLAGLVDQGKVVAEPRMTREKEAAILRNSQNNEVAYKVLGQELYTEEGLAEMPSNLESPLDLGPLASKLHKRAKMGPIDPNTEGFRDRGEEQAFSTATEC